jgi:UPF0716 family protein affecting phage T7 exclusion
MIYYNFIAIFNITKIIFLMIPYLLIGLYLLICFLIAHKIGRHKKIGFWPTLILCLIATTFVGFLVAEGSGLKNALGCQHCGNKENEAEYCGLCGKNALGELRSGFKVRGN